MQKKVGNTLYVFDTTPFTITEDTDAEVIYVQNECLKGYLELNTELESKIKTFNQWLLCVNAPWADGGTTEPTKNYHLLTVSDVEELYVRDYDTNLPPGGADNAWFDSFNEYQRNAGMINNAERNKIYCNPGAKIFIGRDIIEFETVTGLEIIDISGEQRYGVIMGDSDMTVEYSYTLKPTYHINFSEDSNASADIEIDPQERCTGGTVWIRFKNNQSSNTITVTSTDVEFTYDTPNDEYSFTMPEHDVTIKAVYATEQPQNYHLLTIPGYNSTNLYVYGYDNNTLPGEASNLWFHNVNEYQRNAGMIDANVTDKIYCNAGAEVFIMNPTDIFETMTGFNIIDTTEHGQKYGVIMGDSDMTVDLSYTLKPTYNINFSEDSTANNDITIFPNPQFASKSVLIRFKNGQSSSTITITSADVELTYDDSNNWYSFIMPDHDITIKAVYANA